MSSKPGFWRKCRITFRWLRIAVWLLVLAGLGALLWFNRVGLPDFLKTPLVTALREKGVELEFSRMRVSLAHGLVADDVRAGQHGTNNGPSFAARLVQLEVDFPALLHRRLALNGIRLRDGTFDLPLSPTNTLALTNLQAELRFGTNDTWSFDRLGADFAGVLLDIRGEVAHAREARNWKMFAPGGSADHGPAAATLKDFSDVFQQIHFQGATSLRLKIAGDARDVHSIVVQLDAGSDEVRTPWFFARDFQMAATLTAPADAPTNIVESAGFWTNLQPFRLAWAARLGTLRSEKLDADALACSGLWSAPMVTVTNVSARLGGGMLDAGATLDVPARRVEFNCKSSFDPHVIGKFFDEKTRAQLAEVSWAQPPGLKAEGSLRVPPWTNFSAAYNPALALRGEAAFTNTTVRNLKLDRVQTHFRYFDRIWELPDLTVAQGRTELRLSGQGSEVTRNFRFLLDGRIDAASVEAMLPTTNAVHGFRLLTFHEPLALALDVAGNLRALETLSVTGRLALTNFAIRDQTMDSVTAKIHYTNLAANIYAPELWRDGGRQWLKADEAFLDFRRKAIWITNGLALADPQAIACAVGPKTGRVMEQFHFLSLPLTRVHGSTPIINIHTAQDAELADLTFDFEQGVPFHWARLRTTNLTGTVRWLKQSLFLTNMAAPLYEGHGTGFGEIDFRPVGHDCDFDFSFSLTNVNLHLLASDLSTNKNTNLDGQLTGTVTVTNASSGDWRSWNGHGHVWLRDGLLWDVPMFAFMSPVLNTVTPGLGNSRATEASAQFLITNGVITTDSLTIHAQMMQLEYVGTVDLKENVNAKVTAKLFRNMPVVGPVVSKVLWPVGKIFECRVTGQLNSPVVTPVYIPKILLMPLHPLRSLEEFFLPSPSTNSSASD
jgi:hypothetical protein